MIRRLPDLQPLCCRLPWTADFNAGVTFEILLSASELARWARTRSSLPDCKLVADFAELEETTFRIPHFAGAARIYARACGKPVRLSQP